MLTAQQVHAQRELQLAAVAGSLAHAAAQRGGTIAGSAAELHKLFGTPSPLLPRSALQLEREMLPALSRRGVFAGADVRRLAADRWEIRTGAPIPPRAA
jgi:hypothetical protein